MRQALKRAFPWLAHVVRRTRAAAEPVRRAAEEIAVAATLGKGFRVAFRPDVVFRVHPLAWRASIGHFASGRTFGREMDAFLATCYGGMTLVDVGANFGAYALAASARTRARCLLIDPGVGSVRMLKRLRAMNRLEGDWIVEQLAAGDSSGELPVEVLNDFSVAAPIHDTTAQTSRVRQARLDDVLAGHGLRPTHLKIDVEGWELHVLRGAERTLSRARPLLFLEVHHEYLRHNGIDASQVIELVASHGYRMTWSEPEPGPDGGVFVTRTIWAPPA